MTGVLPHRALGTSGIDVSVLSLGSFMTFEHISKEAGIAVMRAARECGIDFLDDARYNDRTGTAPIPTGYSEVLFGDLFRESGWRREDAVVANKLWLEFWPAESPAAELDGSLLRMGFDYLDLVYCASPPDGLALADLVADVGALVASGKARAWGVLNWPPALLRDACRSRRDAESRHPAPPNSRTASCRAHRSRTTRWPAALAELRCQRGRVGRARRWRALGQVPRRHRRGSVDPEPSTHRASHRRSQATEALGGLADEVGATPAALAVAFALSNPAVASVLFGATSAEQVEQNVRALDVLVVATDAQIDALRRIGA